MTTAGSWGLWGTLAASLLSCSSELPSTALHEELVAYFASLGIEPDSVHCPDAPPRTVGATVECEAWVDGESVDMLVEVTSVDGALALRPRHATLVTAQVEPEIAQALRAEGHVVSTVHCEGRLWVARPQARHRCEVRVEGGGRLAWIGTFSGEGSRHQARIVPWPDGPEVTP